MRSIPTIFIIDKATRLVIDKPIHQVGWVFKGEGYATRKWDGLAIKVDALGKVYRRYEWREGDPMPQGFVRVQDPNPKKPHLPIPGWVPISDHFLKSPRGSEEIALREAWVNYVSKGQAELESKYKAAHQYDNREAPRFRVGEGTYELCGPRIRGNHEGFKYHVLIPHGRDIIKKVPTTYQGLKEFLVDFEGEGIVWWSREKAFDGSHLMAKIKRRDFGFFTKAEPKVEDKKEETSATDTVSSVRDANPNASDSVSVQAAV